MGITVADLAYPVIAVEGCTVEVHREAKSLTFCTPEALRGGYYTRVRLLSVDGRQFTVKRAQKASTLKRWWAPPIFVTFISVRLEIEQMGDVKLEELKGVLKRVYRAFPDSWDEIVDITYPKFSAELDRCASFREVAEYVGRF